VVRFPREARDFSLFQSVHTGSGLHSGSYSEGTGALALGLRRRWLKVVSKVIEWSFTSPLP